MFFDFFINCGYVLSGFDIPVSDMLTQLSDPYLRLELYPRCLFPLSQYIPQTTETKKKTLNPYWNEIFQIMVPEKYFFMNGACLCVTVLDHDIMSYNDLAGQAFLPLATIMRLDSLSTKSLATTPISLHLEMPTKERFSETFRILEQRMNKRDALAREVVEYEKYLCNYRILPPSALDSKESKFNNGIELSKQQLMKTISNLFSIINKTE